MVFKTVLSLRRKLKTSVKGKENVPSNQVNERIKEKRSQNEQKKQQSYKRKTGVRINNNDASKNKEDLIKSFIDD
ncbi:hypothetical protein F8M41_013370 [Gigaspora margarita]|uniref:Uncharacterized protein n=1 Tax=Gigaspora margarita TaxID=4874 RepID=A0A8H4ASJ5_GIGMA|nr:hypothetical protein F8M41_013370 [Gigaspora margarita]